MNNKFTLENYNCENLGEILGFTDNAGERWLSAKQIGKWLEIDQIRKTIINIDEENKKFIATTDFSDGNNITIRINNRGEWFVNYEGFLEIAIKSRTPRAKQVKKFIARVFKEVVETGSFSLNKQKLDVSNVKILAQTVLEQCKEIERLELENKQQALQIENQEQELEEKEQVIDHYNNRFYNENIDLGDSVAEIAAKLENKYTGEDISRNGLYAILRKLGILIKEKTLIRGRIRERHRLSTNKALNPVFRKNTIQRTDITKVGTFPVITFLQPAVDEILKILENEYGYVLKAGMRGNTSPQYDY